MARSGFKADRARIFDKKLTGVNFWALSVTSDAQPYQNIVRKEYDAKTSFKIRPTGSG